MKKYFIIIYAFSLSAMHQPQQQQLPLLQRIKRKLSRFICLDTQQNAYRYYMHPHYPPAGQYPIQRIYSSVESE